jgi:hypothetical protein
MLTPVGVELSPTFQEEQKMQRCKVLAAALLLMAIAASGQTAKVYPGASKFTPPDTAENRAALKAMPAGTQAAYYITKDSFEKVVEFYKGLGKEYSMPYQKKGGKLPSGQELKQAYFIFDGAKDISESKSWAKIQRPFIGGVEFKGGRPEYQDVRDVTAIDLLQKK